MNKFLVPLGLLLAFAGIGSCATVSTYNSLTAQEQGVEATWRDSQVWYDNFWKKVGEVAQVTDRYKKDFREVFQGAIEGRYASDRPAQFIMESNPSLSPELYVNVQRVIESGRDDFAQTQRTLVDRQRAYSVALKTFPTVLLASTLGFPHDLTGENRPVKDVDGDGRYTVLDFPTVLGGRTRQAFATGEDEALQVFPQ
jgi:hypothetical protein